MNFQNQIYSYLDDFSKPKIFVFGRFFEIEYIRIQMIFQNQIILIQLKFGNRIFQTSVVIKGTEDPVE